MKTSLFSIAAMTLLTCSASAMANSNVTWGVATNTNTGSAFDDGTRVTRLSDADRANLEQYINQSKAMLQAALDDAHGRSLDQMNDIYFKAVRRVVLDSYSTRARTELLMRFVLNQALELTYGVPTADGKGIAKAGILNDGANRDIITVILEDSIRLALEYVQADFEALSKMTLVDLPFSQLAAKRLSVARTWVASVLENDKSESLLRTVLQHWLNTMAQDDQMHQAKLALEIRDIDEFLKDQDIQISSPDERIRGMRGKLKWLLARLNGTTATPPQLRASTGPDFTPEQKKAAELLSKPAETAPREITDHSTTAEIARMLVPDGGISFGYSIVAPDNAGNTRAVQISVNSALFDVCKGENDCNSSTAPVSGFHVLPFSMTMRMKLSDSAQGGGFEANHVLITPVDVVMKSLGLTMSTLSYEYQRFDFNMGALHKLVIGPASVELIKPIPSTDGTLEFVVRGSIELGFVVAADIQQDNGEGFQALTAGGNGSFGIRIAKTVMLEITGGASALTDPIGMDAAGKKSHYMSILDYGAKLSVQATSWLSFTVTVNNESQVYQRYGDVPNDPNAYAPAYHTAKAAQTDLSGWVANASVEVKW